MKRSLTFLILAASKCTFVHRLVKKIVYSLQVAQLHRQIELILICLSRIFVSLALLIRGKIVFYALLRNLVSSSVDSNRCYLMNVTRHCSRKTYYD
ncbi:hypothetical protein F4859DRAFT_470710 [Xylaria cf. heliscus]|nr:hypothetical protein F4859DRAFT_470710 [Xylaria cf. heliscus]